MPGPGPQEAAWRELEAERAQLQSQLQREREELLARLEAEKEELSEEIAALQQERDEGLLLAESEKQQVCEPWCGLRCCLRGPCSATRQLGARSPSLGLGVLACRMGELKGHVGSVAETHVQRAMPRIRDTVSVGSRKAGPRSAIPSATAGWPGCPQGCLPSSPCEACMYQQTFLKRTSA